MIKTKRILLTLLIFLMCVSLVFTAFACKDKEDPSTTGEVEELDTLFTNGNFTATSSANDAAYPHTPENWTGTPGSTSSSSTLKTPQGEKDLAAGIIDIEKTDATLGGSPNKPIPDKNKDSKVLMINNKTLTAYSYVSDNITLSKDKYYKLSLYVKTTNIENKKGTRGGAYITVTGNAYANFDEIDTKGEWKEYAVYFRSSTTNDYSIQLTLSLGTGNLDTGYMTKGYAYFDAIVLEDLTDVKEDQTAFTEADFNKLVVSPNLAKCDMRTIDKNFNYISSMTSIPYTPSQLTGKGGSGSGTTASTGSSWVEKGIIDLSDVNNTYTFSALGSEPYTLTKVSDASIGDRMLFIHNKNNTAYGYKDNLGLSIERNKYYEISVYVKTSIVDGNGATVRLVTSGNAVLSQVKSINTNNTWAKVTFYLEGNSYADNIIHLEMWLGTGGSGDGDWTKGVAFFDDLSYDIIDAATYTAKKADIEGGIEVNAATHSFKEAEGTLIELNNTVFKSTQYNDSFLKEDGSLKYSSISFETIEVFDAPTTALVAKNNMPSSLSFSTIYKTALDQDTVDEHNKELITILPNTAYELSFWVKTVDLAAASSASLNIISYDVEKKNDFANATTSLVNISSINSENLKNYVDEERDGYTRYVVYILGAEKDTTYAGIKVTLGTGENAAQSSGFVTGSFYLTNIRLQTIDYATYVAASTSTVIHKKSLGGAGTNGELSSNGTFTFVDISSTNTTYEGHLDEVWVDNKLVGTAVPQNWSISNSTLLTVNGGSSTAGVINVNNYPLSSINSSLDVNNVYENLPSEMTPEKYPNVLYINAVSAPFLGYSSQSITLEARAYYVVSVYARVLEGECTIDVTPTSYNKPLDTALFIDSTDVGSGWAQYFFYIKTGVTSTSVKVSLYANNLNNTENSVVDSKVLFTLATYSKIEEAVYDSAEKVAKDTTNPLSSRIKLNSWFTDRMDTTSTTFDNKLDTPSNWTGAAVDSNSSISDDDVVKGVFNRVNGNWDLIDINPDETDSFGNTIYANSEKTGDSVLVIYNKEASTYSYSCKSFTLDAGKYYRISIDVLTKDIKYLTKEIVDKDEEKYADWEDKKSYETATITLSLNNKNYSFGKTVEKDKKLTDFTGDKASEEFADYEVDVKRIVNPSEWTTYTFYIALDKEIEETVSASLKLSIGGKNVSYWQSGYLFLDNFEFEEMDAIAFEGDEGVDPTVPKASELTKDNALTATTYRIDFTNEDATAEQEPEETEEPAPENNTGKDFLWLYITSGIIGALLVIILLIYIIKKYAPKQKKIKKSKKTTISKDATRNKFSD